MAARQMTGNTARYLVDLMISSAWRYVEPWERRPYKVGLTIAIVQNVDHRLATTSTSGFAGGQLLHKDVPIV